VERVGALAQRGGRASHLFFPQANCLFKNFEVLGPADKTLIYLTLFISEALQKIGNCDLESAKKEMYTLSIQEFWTPASPTWPLVG
jgi:actin related protein 2/3 complex subunit 3